MLWRSGRSLRQIGVAAGQRVWNRHPEGWVHRAGQVTLEHQPATPRPVDAGYRHGGTQHRGVMVSRTFAAIEEDPTVYHTINGPNEFHVIGTMRDWTIVDRLHRIEAPTWFSAASTTKRPRPASSPFWILSPTSKAWSSRIPATCRMSRKSTTASPPSGASWPNTIDVAAPGLLLQRIVDTAQWS